MATPSEANSSRLEELRRAFKPVVPKVLLSGEFEIKKGDTTSALGQEASIEKAFPNLYGQPFVDVVPKTSTAAAYPCELSSTPAALVRQPSKHNALRIGCVLSGGQAAGGHSCICGLFDYLQAHAPGSALLGFVGGPAGVMRNAHRILRKEHIDHYRSSGGFTMLASGRDKIETQEQLAKAVATAKEERLDGLVVIGGDDSNTNAALLAEHFLSAGAKTRVIGLPKTIDGDLKNEHIGTSFGFDTAAKLYSELVGNIMVDCESSRKYYHFIRLMGREASHLTLEVALRTKPNLAFIGEEVRREGRTLAQITEQVADMVVTRSEAGLDFGVVLIPEGLVDFVPEVSQLIHELNEILARFESDSNCYEGVTEERVGRLLSDAAGTTFDYLPETIRSQLLLDRDPHGNVQVAKIESERLLADLVENELRLRQAYGYKGKFAAQCHYLGYEGRCPPPTNFDANYCYALGLTSAALIGCGCTGMMAAVRGLASPPESWTLRGVPLTAMMCVERRKGKDKPVVRKALVDLEGRPFGALVAQREAWILSTRYVSPGPVQFWGAASDDVTLTLRHEQEAVKAATAAAIMDEEPPLRKRRREERPQLPATLAAGAAGDAGDAGDASVAASALRLKSGEVPTAQSDALFIKGRLPRTYGMPRLELTTAGEGEAITPKEGLTLGVVFCGRQCPGAHNVVAGVAEYLRRCGGASARLLGFKDGTRGLFRADAIELAQSDVDSYVNAGGMQLMGRSADVVRTEAQLAQVEQACLKLKLDGLIMVGGPVSASDTACLAERFVERGVPTRIIGVPATIDGDLRPSHVEQSIGFDTASKVYSSLVGNLAVDAASARKYWYFVRLMGRSPSHVALECALHTQPNLTLIGEEVAARRMTLKEVVTEIADTVMERARLGKNFGVVLIPEGLVGYIPEVSALLREIAAVRRALGRTAATPGGRAADARAVQDQLTPWASALLLSLPFFIRQQLLLESTASDDSAQLGQIETERLLAELVRVHIETAKRDAMMAAEPFCDPKFQTVCFYLGYQARSSLPSRFDCDLGYTLGHGAAALAAASKTGYMATAHCLSSPTAEWRVCGVPLYAMMGAEKRAGVAIPAVTTHPVDLDGASFRRFAAVREVLKEKELYCNPGPVQFDGPLAGAITHRLNDEQHARAEKLRELAAILGEVDTTCWPGCSADVLSTALASMRALQTNLQILRSKELSAGHPRKPHRHVVQETSEQQALRDN